MDALSSTGLLDESKKRFYAVFLLTHFLSNYDFFKFRQGHLQMVVQLMSYGADPSLRDGEGE